MEFLILVAILGVGLLIGYNVKIVGEKIDKKQIRNSNKDNEDYIDLQIQKLKDDIKREVKDDIKQEMNKKSDE